MKKTNKPFEEFYFEGYYQGIGNFSRQRDRELQNWFRSMFTYLQKYYPLEEGKGKTLIEFGCATGAASTLLRDYGYKVTATDISEYAIKRAKQNHADIRFLTHDMQKKFPKENYFDIAIAFDVIEHLQNPELGLKYVYKMLKKNGTMILSTPNDYPHSWSDPTHVNVKPPHEWEKLVKEAGFRSIFIRQVTFIPYFYRLHWRLNFAMPIAVPSRYFVSPVFVIAQK